MVVSRSTSSGSCHAPFPPSPPSAAAASDAAYAAAPCCNSDRRPAVACVSRLPHPHNKSSSIALALAPSINCPLTTDRRRLLHFAVGASGSPDFCNAQNADLVANPLLGRSHFKQRDPHGCGT
jgi:hypothetical protein